MPFSKFTLSAFMIRIKGKFGFSVLHEGGDNTLQQANPTSEPNFSFDIDHDCTSSK